jgi:hypothetical protein
MTYAGNINRLSWHPSWYAFPPLHAGRIGRHPEDGYGRRSRAFYLQEITVSTFHLSRTGSRVLLLAALALGSAQAGAAQLITNGGFEADAAATYAPSGWIVSELGGLGAVSADNAGGGLSPASGWASAGAASGSYFGSIDAYTLGAWSLAQTFSTSAVSKATLSFQMFINDQSDEGHAIVGSNLDWSGASDLYYARVDILKAGADTFATGTDVVKSLYIGGATGRKYGSQSNSYLSYSFDLSDVLAAGGEYTLRFAVVNNIPAQMQLGVDNVSLQVTTAVPEPQSYALMLAGLGVVGAIARRRRA